MSNIKIRYLYRDGSNYKKWGELVFSNPDGVRVERVAALLQPAFLADGLFIAHQIRVPDVFLARDYGLDVDDHCYHEFDSVEATSDPPNDLCGRSIGEFVNEVERESRVGWRAFDPPDTFVRRHA